MHKTDGTCAFAWSAKEIFIELAMWGVTEADFTGVFLLVIDDVLVDFYNIFLIIITIIMINIILVTITMMITMSIILHLLINNGYIKFQFT